MIHSLSILLHAHLPFVRHPEHDPFLEETWFFEAVAECYLPLLKILEGWRNDGVTARITLSLSPTLCSMLVDPLLQERCRRYLMRLNDLAASEVIRTHWEPEAQKVAQFYKERFEDLSIRFESLKGNLVPAFRQLQESGQIEIITTSATHAILPLLAPHPESLRAQIMTARDFHLECFGTPPRGIWLPECAYAPEMEWVLAEAGIKWFTLDTHGLIQSTPRPRYSYHAPVITPSGLAAFGRDPGSAHQVWSRHAGYPGDPRYRDFYRDIAFDLDFEYLKPHLPNREARSFTGIKYHRITGSSDKALYNREEALAAAQGHAGHFLDVCSTHLSRVESVTRRPCILVAPYDAELFGHWWFEGPEFLDAFVRKASNPLSSIQLVSPTDYLRKYDCHQKATPNASTWGDGGHLRVWLNEQTSSIYPPLRKAQQMMPQLVREQTDPKYQRFLKQAARELLLAQSSDWPFILTTTTSTEYARKRFATHISRFHWLTQQLSQPNPDFAGLEQIEDRDNLFQNINIGYWK